MGRLLQLLRLHFCSGLVLLGILAAMPAWAQDISQRSAEEMRRLQSELGGRNCPGDPPGNLTSFDCSFTRQMRAIEFLSTSVTDQAVGGATLFGSFAYFTHRDPPEWERGWGSFGRSIGTRYAQNLAKGTATLALGWMITADPRYVSLSNDPRFPRTTPPGTGARIGHALFDWISVRRSSPDGNGSRWPNLPLWSGAAVSGLVGNAFQPHEKATVKSGIVTASSSLGTALAASFYTEFSPELARLFGGIVKRGRVPSSTGAGRNQ
jgi:hypothetical protein